MMSHVKENELTIEENLFILNWNIHSLYGGVEGKVYNLNESLNQ